MHARRRVLLNRGTATSRSSFPPDFQRFWLAAAVSNLGDGVRAAALPLLALQVTDSRLGVAGVTALTTAQWLIAGPLGGIAVDRLDRRRLMVAAQAGRAVAVGVLAVVTLTSSPPLWLLYVVALAVGVGEVLVDTSSQAAVPMLAPDGPDGLERANGRLSAAQTLLDQIVGAPLGAALFVVGAGAPFLFDTASFIIALLLLATITTPLQPPREPGPRTSLWADARAGVATVWRTPVLRGLAISVGLFNVILGSTFALLVLLVVDELDGDERVFGLVLSAGAAGGFLGALAAARIVRRFGRARLIVVATALAGAANGALGLAPHPAVVALLLFVSAASVIAFNVVSQSVRQALSPPDMLGRVVAGFRTLGMAGAPLGALLGGVGATFVGVRGTYLLAGALSLVPLAAMIAASRHLAAPTAADPTTGRRT